MGINIIVVLPSHWLRCKLKHPQISVFVTLLLSNYLLATETAVVRTVALGAVSMGVSRMGKRESTCLSFIL